jgi:hypothetical protein
MLNTGEPYFSRRSCVSVLLLANSLNLRAQEVHLNIISTASTPRFPPSLSPSALRLYLHGQEDPAQRFVCAHSRKPSLGSEREGL